MMTNNLVENRMKKVFKVLEHLLYEFYPLNSGGYRGGVLGASAPPAESMVKKS